MRDVIAVLTLVASVSGPVAAAGWQQYQDPAEAGWSTEGLARARTIAEEAGSAAVLVIEEGIVVAAWGQVDRPWPIYSMRKGLYNALVGMLVADGKLELGSTLGELGIEDLEPLSDMESSATLEDLLTARSGIYLESAYEPASMKRDRPERGAHPPGEHWFYNNWDFNVVAHLIEEASGHDLAALFEERLAVPLEMEDATAAAAFPFLEPSRSKFPAAIFRMSARDLARVGQLYLQDGVWNGERLLAEGWVAASWTPRTTFPAGSPWGAGNGFGYLWWIHPARTDGERPFARHDVYLTRGSDGQVLAVLPELDLVIVHLTASEAGSFDVAVQVINAVIAAQGAPATVALEARPLGDPPPVPELRTPVEWTRATIDALTGEYALSPRMSFLVHELDGRLFALPRGVPLAEVELFRDATGTIFSPAVDVALEVVTDEAGEIVALEGSLDGRPVRMERVRPSGGDR